MAKINYKQKVLDYLVQRANEYIQRDILISETGISKSRLSEILNSIREDGYIIDSPPRSGMLKLLQGNDQNIIPAIKDSDLRMWLIIFILSRYGSLSFRDLVLKILSIKDYDMEYSLKISGRKAYDDNHLIKSIRSENSSEMTDPDTIDVASEHLSVTTLRKDLTALREMGIVAIKQDTKVRYELTGKAPYIITLSDDSLYSFCQHYEEHMTTTTELLPVRNVYQKAKMIMNLEGADYTQRVFGKTNQISQKQIDTFNRFIAHPYKTNRLFINSAYRDKKRHDLISVCLLFYSVETGFFYALCENHTKNSMESVRLDYIDGITDTEEKNTVFHNESCFKVYEEMFGAGYEREVHHVKVLVQDFGNNITPRFRNLCGLRNEASFRPIENPPEGCIYSYIYEDNVRGLEDFARYLRSFGYSVLALEPPELKEKMLKSYHRTLEKYDKLESLIIKNEKDR